MPIETTRHNDQDLTIHVVTGPVSEAQIFGSLEDAYDPAPTALILWDMSQSDLSHIKPETIRKFMRRAAELGSVRQQLRF